MHANPKQGRVSIPYQHHYAQTFKKRFQPNEWDTLLIYYAFINVLH